MSVLSDVYYVYYYAALTIAVLSIIFHAIGLYAIKTYKKKVNQNIILCSLSAVEILTSVYRITFEVVLNKIHQAHAHEGAEVKNHSGLLGPVLRPCLFSIYYMTGYGLMFTMGVLTLDRAVLVVNPLKYRVRLSRKRFQILVITSWVLSIIIGVGIGCTPSIELRKKLNGFGLALLWLYIVFAIVTYTFIIYKVKKSRNTFRNPTQPTQPTTSHGKQYMVSAVIISTCFIFYVIPQLLLMIGRWGSELSEIDRRSKSVVYSLCILLPNVGNLVDAVTYIVLVKHYRNNMTKVFRSLMDRSFDRSTSSLEPSVTFSTV